MSQESSSDSTNTRKDVQKASIALKQFSKDVRKLIRSNAKKEERANVWSGLKITLAGEIAQILSDQDYIRPAIRAKSPLKPPVEPKWKTDEKKLHRNLRLKRIRQEIREDQQGQDYKKKQKLGSLIDRVKTDLLERKHAAHLSEAFSKIPARPSAEKLAQLRSQFIPINDLPKKESNLSDDEELPNRESFHLQWRKQNGFRTAQDIVRATRATQFVEDDDDNGSGGNFYPHDQLESYLNRTPSLQEKVPYFSLHTRDDSDDLHERDDFPEMFQDSDQSIEY